MRGGHANRVRVRGLLVSAALLAATLALPLQAQPPYTNVNEFLPPEEAFQLQVRATADGYRAAWTIAPGYYMYRKAMAVRVAGDKLAIDPPPGEIITDEFFGETAVFRHQVAFGFAPPPSAAAVDITYQGCADAGLCYSPITQQIALANTPAPMSGAPTTAPVTQSPQEEVFSMLRDGTILVTLGGFLLYGILLAFTPCVLPVLPILLRTLTQGEPQTRGRAALLSTVYVLAFSLVYSVLGVASGLLGESVQAWLQKPWLLTVFAVFFVLLALSMFGAFRLQMPTGIQSKLNNVALGAKGGLGGSATMGVVSALVVGPCVTPALIGALLFIAQTRDALLGGLALFFLGLGMGAPLILAGTYFSRYLPKPGAVRDTMNAVIGFLMLAVAVWILDRIVPSSVTLLLTGTWMVVAGVFAFSHTGARADATTGSALLRGVCVAVALYGAILIVGAATGGHSLLKPLEQRAVKVGEHQSDLPFRDVADLNSIHAAVAEAAQTGRWTMLDFYADWCISCKEMEAFTFPNAAVKTALADMQLLRIDVTANNNADKETLKHFGLFGPPAILFFSPEGREASSARLFGFIRPARFAEHIDRVRRAAAI